MYFLLILIPTSYLFADCIQWFIATTVMPTDHLTATAFAIAALVWIPLALTATYYINTEGCYGANPDE
jgi:hypothetical protein